MAQIGPFNRSALDGEQDTQLDQQTAHSVTDDAGFLPELTLDGPTIEPPSLSKPADHGEPSGTQHQGRSNLRIGIIMTSFCLAYCLTALDFTIITTALPTITSHFHSSAGYTWIGSAYFLTDAASMPTWSKVSDIWGRKPSLLTAIVLFFIGSLICGIATSMAMLIAGRAVQGVAAGGIIVLINICIADLFSMRARGAYWAITEVFLGLSSALGPLLGGILTQYVSWRWCFYINLPLSGLAFVSLFLCLNLHNPRTPLIRGLKAVDWLGSLTIMGLTMMFLLGLDFGGLTFPWNSPQVICLIVLGFFVMGGLFLTAEAKAKYPLMPLRIFKYRTNIAVIVVSFCHGFVSIPGSYYLPLYFQAVKGASPLVSGALVLPFAVIQCVSAAVSGVVTKSTGHYLEAMWVGTTLVTLGYGLFISFDVNTGVAKIVAFQVVAGIGIGPLWQTPLIALQAFTSPQDYSSATSTLFFLRVLATSMSVVIGGVVFQNSMQSRASQLRVALGSANATQLSGESAAANVMVLEALDPTQKSIAKAAFAGSIRSIWVLYTCVAAAGVVASAFVSKRELSKEHVETKTGIGNEDLQRRQGHQVQGSAGDEVALEQMGQE